MNANPGWNATQVIWLVREELLLERLADIVQILSLNESISGRSHVKMEQAAQMSASNGQYSRPGCSWPLAMYVWKRLAGTANIHTLC